MTRPAEGLQRPSRALRRRMARMYRRALRAPCNATSEAALRRSRLRELYGLLLVLLALILALGA